MSKHRKKYISNLGIRTIDYNKLNKYNNFFHFIRMDQVVEHVDKFKNIFKIFMIFTSNVTKDGTLGLKRSRFNHACRPNAIKLNSISG